MIAYDEFCELTTILDPTSSAASPTKHDQSPLRDEKKEPSVFSSPGDDKPVKTFELSETKPVTKQATSPEKLRDRSEAEKAADEERKRIEQ